jgi:hypothetical protein
MCFKWFRKKDATIKDEKIIEANPSPVSTRITIAGPSMKFLVERYIILCENLNEKNWRIPFYTDLMYEAIRIGGIVERLERNTKEKRRLYKIYKKYEKHIIQLLKPPPIDPDIVHVKPVKEIEAEKITWFTKVERFDENGYLVSIEYLR